MGVTDYIPLTTGWYQRRYKKYLRRLGRKASAVVFLEYPDKQVVPWPAEWDEDLQGWVLPNGLTVYPRGKGGEPKRMAGVDVVYAYAPNAGVISTEASLLGRALEFNDFTPVDETGQAIDTEELAQRAPNPGQTASDQAVADGGLTGAGATDRIGTPDAESVLERTGAADAVTNFPLYHAVEYELSDADEFDPAPVDASDARLAAEKKKQAARDESELMKYAGLALAAGVILALVVVGFIWLINQIQVGGGGGAESGGGVIFGSLQTTVTLLGGGFGA